MGFDRRLRAIELPFDSLVDLCANALRIVFLATVTVSAAVVGYAHLLGAGPPLDVTLTAGLALAGILMCGLGYFAATIAGRGDGVTPGRRIWLYITGGLTLSAYFALGFGIWVGAEAMQLALVNDNLSSCHLADQLFDCAR